MNVSNLTLVFCQVYLTPNQTENIHDTDKNEGGMTVYHNIQPDTISAIVLGLGDDILDFKWQPEDDNMYPIT